MVLPACSILSPAPVVVPAKQIKIPVQRPDALHLRNVSVVACGDKVCLEEEQFHNLAYNLITIDRFMKQYKTFANACSKQ